MSEIVKYHNDLNNLQFKDFTKEELDVFFSIISAVREKGSRKVVIDKFDIIRLANYTLERNADFKQLIENLVSNVGNLRYIIDTPTQSGFVALFQSFSVDWSNGYSDMVIEAQVSEKFEYALNKLQANFTLFELEEFTNMTSIYSKALYRHLKQWRTVGKKRFTTEEFRDLLAIPKSYKASDIDKRVLKYINRDFPQYFEKFKVKKIKENTRGNPITHYEFAWKPEKTGTWVENKYKKPKKEVTPEWLEDKNLREPDIDTETNSDLKKRLEDLRNKRPKNK